MAGESTTENPLGTKPLGRLLFSLALPAIIANVFNALYNIVDQIFIGQGVRKLGKRQKEQFFRSQSRLYF